MSFSDFTKIITNIISRIVITTFLNIFTILQNLINNNEVIVKSIIIKTLITKIISTKIVTKTYTHSTIFIIIVIISLFCTYDENKLFVTNNVFLRLKFQSLYFSQKLYFQSQVYTQ